MQRRLGGNKGFSPRLPSCVLLVLVGDDDVESLVAGGGGVAELPGGAMLASVTFILMATADALQCL